jgi:tetratricopeptide (TPR) repeat protein
VNTYIEEQLRRVARMIELHEFRDATAELRQLEPYLVDDGRYYRLRGLAHFGLGEFEQATIALETASLLVPLDSAAQIRLAQLYQQRRRREAAKTIYLHLATTESLTEEEVELTTIGLAGVGAVDDALRYSLGQMQRFGRSHKLAFAAADAMRRLGYGDDPILKLIHRAHRLQPDNVSYRIALARSLVSAGRRVEATQILHEVDLDATQCIPSLEWMRMLFERLNVTDGVEHCRARLQAIAYEASSTFRPYKGEF